MQQRSHLRAAAVAAKNTHSGKHIMHRLFIILLTLASVFGVTRAEPLNSAAS